MSVSSLHCSLGHSDPFLRKPMTQEPFACCSKLRRPHILVFDVLSRLDNLSLGGGCDRHFQVKTCRRCFFHVSRSCSAVFLCMWSSPYASFASCLVASRRLLLVRQSSNAFETQAHVLVLLNTISGKLSEVACLRFDPNKFLVEIGKSPTGQPPCC